MQNRQHYKRKIVRQKRIMISILGLICMQILEPWEWISIILRVIVNRFWWASIPYTKTKSQNLDNLTLQKFFMEVRFKRTPMKRRFNNNLSKAFIAGFSIKTNWNRFAILNQRDMKPSSFFNKTLDLPISTNTWTQLQWHMNWLKTRSYYSKLLMKYLEACHYKIHVSLFMMNQLLCTRLSLLAGSKHKDSIALRHGSPQFSNKTYGQISCMRKQRVAANILTSSIYLTLTKCKRASKVISNLNWTYFQMCGSIQISLRRQRFSKSWKRRIRWAISQQDFSKLIIKMLHPKLPLKNLINWANNWSREKNHRMEEISFWH